MKIMIALSISSDMQEYMPTQLVLQFIGFDNPNLLLLLKQKGFTNFNFAVDIKSQSKEESFKELFNLRLKKKRLNTHKQLNINTKCDSLKHLPQNVIDNIKQGISKSIPINVDVDGESENENKEDMLFDWIIIIRLTKDIINYNIIEGLIMFIANIDFQNKQNHGIYNDLFYCFNSSLEINEI